MPMNFDEAVARITTPGERFELTGVRRRDDGDLQVFRNAPQTLQDVFKAARKFGDRTFLVFGHERRTFNEVLDEADALAGTLASQYGVVKGDRVAIAMRNYPEWITAFIAITALGATVVSVNAMWTAHEIDFALGDSAPILFIGDPERVSRARSSAERHSCQLLVVRGEDRNDGLDHWEDVLETTSPPEVRIEPEDDATILYTSGTTGKPKGAVSTHRAICNALVGFEAMGAIDGMIGGSAEPSPSAEDSAALLAVPLFHVTGCVAVMLGCLRGGYRMVIMKKWDPQVALQLIERERIGTFCGVPTQSLDMINAPRFADYDTSSLISVGGGGAPTPPTLLAEICSAFASASPAFGWGMTETNAYGPAASGAHAMAHPGSAGRVPPGMELEIRDPDTFLLTPPGESGEIWVRGATLVRGYWRNESATQAAFVDGWLRTGDLGHLDNDGYVYVDDRLKEMVLRGGENVYCSEVEAAIYEHPSVREAAVVGVPDQRLGEVVAAVIVVRSGMNLDEEELRSFLATRLAAYKLPALVDLRDEPLPRTATGKLLKTGLRADLIDRGA